jgi:hypothetical protein
MTVEWTLEHGMRSLHQISPVVDVFGRRCIPNCWVPHIDGLL